MPKAIFYFAASKIRKYIQIFKYLWQSTLFKKTDLCVFVLILQVYKDRKWLGNISYSSGCMQYKTNVNTCSKETLPQDYQVKNNDL